MPLSIPFHDAQGYLRHYTPDFVVKTAQGYFLLETKGEGWDTQEDTRIKGEAAIAWCRKVAQLTCQSWTFGKILESDFDRFGTLPFSQLLSACQGTS